MINIQAAYERFCRTRFPLPTEAQLVNLERRIGARFPDNFRQFVLNYNGGYFNEPRIVPLEQGCPLDRLSMLNGIGAPHESAELGSRADMAIFDDNYPAQVVPIGYTLMGNLLLLITRHEGFGNIVMKIADEQSYFLLGDDIDDFFGHLQEAPDE